jgi:hypothetical protein
MFLASVTLSSPRGACGPNYCDTVINSDCKFLGCQIANRTLSYQKRKPGRPRLPKGQAKGKIVPIRFTKAEAERLADAAKANDQTLSEWIRRKVLAAAGA